jgi:PPM family protein phosphatase
MFARLETAGRTDRGLVRNENQDQFLIAQLSKQMRVHSSSLSLDGASRLSGVPQGTLLMVADGMGGHRGGERASGIAIGFMVNQLLNSVHWLLSEEPQREDAFLQELAETVRRANREIEAQSQADPQFERMGTTLTFGYIVWPKLFLLHVGDSRGYLIRGQSIEQLTSDHTMAAQVAQLAGRSAGDLSSSPLSNVLYNVLGGGSEHVEPELHCHTLLVGDLVLLCSDGLNRHVSDEDIRDALLANQPLEIAVQQLIALANQRGGKDNVTVVAARCLEPEPRPATTRVSAEITLDRLIGSAGGSDRATPAPTAGPASTLPHAADRPVGMAGER